jgi:hypothetical protein
MKYSIKNYKDFEFEFDGRRCVATSASVTGEDNVIHFEYVPLKKGDKVRVKKTGLVAVVEDWDVGFNERRYLIDGKWFYDFELEDVKEEPMPDKLIAMRNEVAQTLFCKGVICEGNLQERVKSAIHFADTFVRHLWKRS